MKQGGHRGRESTETAKETYEAMVEKFQNKENEAVFENIISKNSLNSQTISSPRFQSQYKSQGEETQNSDLNKSQHNC